MEKEEDDDAWCALWTRAMSYIAELAVVEAGVASPLDAVVGRQLPGALRLEEYDGLAEGVLVVEASAGSHRRVQGVAGQHQRREGQGDVGAHAAAVAVAQWCAHGGNDARGEHRAPAGYGARELPGDGKGRDALGFRRRGGARAPQAVCVARCSAKNVSAAPTVTALCSARARHGRMVVAGLGRVMDAVGE